MKLLLSASAALALAACASAPPPAADAQAGKGVQMAGETSLNGPAQTGTRMARKGNERVVRTIGNQTFKEDAADIHTIGNTMGIRGN